MIVKDIPLALITFLVNRLVSRDLIDNIIMCELCTIAKQENYEASYSLMFSWNFIFQIILIFGEN